MKVMKYLYLPLIVATRDGPEMSQRMSSLGRAARIFDRLLFGTGRLLAFPYRHASHMSVEYPLKSLGVTPGSSPAAASCLSRLGAV